MHALLAVLMSLGVAQAPTSAPRDDVLLASRVLHAWDARREAAWAASDPTALRTLYVRGSSAAARDVALLRAYSARGLVVRRLVTQVFALTVLRSTSARLRLRVFDRVAGGEVVAGAKVRPLGTTRPSIRLIELRRVEGSWKVARVSD